MYLFFSHSVFADLLFRASFFPRQCLRTVVVEVEVEEAVAVANTIEISTVEAVVEEVGDVLEVTLVEAINMNSNVRMVAAVWMI